MWLLVIDLLLVMIYIGLTLARRCQRAVFFGRRCLGRLVSHEDSFIADQRGAVALEMPIVWLFLMMSLLLPLADLAIAGFQLVSAWQALRAFGQYIQYNPPPDVTNTSSWTSKLPTTVAGYPISNIQVLCGDTNAGAVCSSTNVTLPTKYYSYTTTVTLAPMVLRQVLCNANPCSFTLPYSERFQ
jgi:Flp pilus assembly protein TadG